MQKVQPTYEPTIGFQYYSDMDHILRLIPNNLIFNWKLAIAWLYHNNNEFTISWWKDPKALRADHQDLYHILDVNTEGTAARVMAAAAYDIR